MRTAQLARNSSAIEGVKEDHLKLRSESNFGAPEWDRDVSSKSPLFDLHLREVWRYRDLLYLFVRRDIVSFYKQTLLGPLWFFIQPLLTTLIYMLVFGKIAGLSTDDTPPILFYLGGVTLWNYFSECFTKTATTFRDNSPLFSKVYFPRIIIPLSIVLSNMVRFFIQFLLFLLILIWYHWNDQVHPNAAMMLLPLFVMQMAVLGLSFGMIFSALTTKYRDLMFLLAFGIQLLMYATPVIYPVSQVPNQLLQIIRWNPLLSIFESLRFAFLGTGGFSIADSLYTTLFAAVSLFAACVIFNQVQRTHMDTI